jgi:hypothetical protein
MKKQPLFEKSGAKTFSSLAHGAEMALAQIHKVFLLLFVHKKKRFSRRHMRALRRRARM